MRIAVYHNLPSGGAKRSLYEGIRRLATRHMVAVFTLSTADHAFADLRPHVADHRVYPFSPLRLLQSPFGRINQAIRVADLDRLRSLGRRIASDIQSGRYDVLFAQPCMFETAPSVLDHLTDLLSVYYCHEPPRQLHEVMPERPYEVTRPRRAALDRIDPLPHLYRSTLARTDRANTCSAGRVLVNSRFTQDAVNRIYGIESQVSYHGVDVDWARPDDGEREPFVLSVGSLTPLKGFDFLIRALAEVTIDLRPPLVIVSNFQNPPERAFLQSLAQELNVALILRCNISDSELADLYRRARVVAYAPVREPFGLVALEAMASATPVVAVAEGGVAESIVHEHTGLLTARDPVEFASALLRVFENRGLAEQLGRNGRDHVLRYWTWDQAATTLEQHLQGVIVQAGRKQTIQKPYAAERIT